MPTTYDIYDRDAGALASRYESRSFEEVHGELADLLTGFCGQVLDVGAIVDHPRKRLKSIGNGVPNTGSTKFGAGHKFTPHRGS